MESSGSEEKKKEEYILSVEEEKVDLRKKEAPLIDVKVTNPVVYLKRWWKRVMAGEGIDIRFRIKPITAFLITIAFVVFSLEAVNTYRSFSAPSPFPSQTDEPEEPKEVKLNLVGKVYKSPNGKYLLLIDQSKAIDLIETDEFNMEGFLGEDVLVSAFYSNETNQARVVDIWAIDIEKVSPQPTLISPVLSPLPQASEESDLQ